MGIFRCLSKKQNENIYGQVKLAWSFFMKVDVLTS
jgi:hypothetical protein